MPGRCWSIQPSRAIDEDLLMLTALEVIRILDLKPLPVEGGFYREMYRSSLILPGTCLGGLVSGSRSAGTAIYYLLTPETFSALHRLRGDEVFHFYLGDPVDMLQLSPDGAGKRIVLGTDLQVGQQPQVVVPGGVWQGSRLQPGGRFALLGTTMAPGFQLDDFEAGQREQLQAQYPDSAAWIDQLTVVA